MPEPVVTIIVLHWRSLSNTIECLNSLHHVDVPKHDIVLVNNGSIDGTVTTVQQVYPTVHIIENVRNLGYVEGNNIGIRYALEHNAEYILLLNNDTVVESDMLAHLMEIALGNPRIGFLCPTIVSYDNPTRQYVGAKIYWDAGAAAELEQSAEGMPEIVDTDYAPGSALLVKSNVIRQIGLLASEFYAYFEDVDWSLRCWHAGYRVVVVPRARVRHKGTMDRNEEKSALATFLFSRNQFVFMRKYAKWYMWFSFLKNSTRLVLLKVKRSKENEDWETVQALVDGWWAGLRGQEGYPQVQTPSWFQNLVINYLETWLWLTGWLFFWDYQNVKRHRTQTMQKLT